MFLYIPCIYTDYYNCNCFYNIKDGNTCAYISIAALLLHPDSQTFYTTFPIIEELYTTKSKSLALLNIKSPITSVRIAANFILGFNHCPFNI